ncbi:efflux RND transporter periplasmic adaptor subunit [Aquiflexum sp. LQ15W]|uniref:efflux RND transporter periplasmic adaptor subunit n=1 Tax=Cognataquiflexum nitidum TaxID=2922272 RepID=UPI001F14375E|nr:efflux RND transporter periplasmic adaptor subunit [Cognataquiflexum nitidum]MCH6198214.1 efflux RND transporter periplasmic adaptor subunit [Cognataquiflexum nitidum]
MKFPKTTLIATVLGLIILQSCGKAENSLNTDIPAGKIPVKIQEIIPSEEKLEIEATGQFTTDDETFLSFKTGGIIAQVLVAEGDFIRKGQLLASLDLTEINTSVTQAKLGFEKSQRDYERIQRLLLDSVATLEQAQNSKTALDIAAQSLEAANFNKDYSQIRATRDGYVLKKFINAGQQIAPGSPVFQTNGSGQGSWKLKASLSDKEWVTVREDDEVRISTAVDSEKYFQGKIKRKAKVADPMTGTYQVEIEFTEKAPEYLASGMFGYAKLSVATLQTTWFVPYEAILDANAGNGFVFITEDDTTAQRIGIQIGKIYSDKVQVTGGLEGFSKLIISGSAYLTDQSSISIQD